MNTAAYPAPWPLPVPPLPPAPPSGVTVPPDEMAVYLSNGARILLDGNDDSVDRICAAMAITPPGTLLALLNVTTRRVELVRSLDIVRVVLPSRISPDSPTLP